MKYIFVLFYASLVLAGWNIDGINPRNYTTYQDNAR